MMAVETVSGSISMKVTKLDFFFFFFFFQFLEVKFSIYLIGVFS